MSKFSDELLKRLDQPVDTIVNRTASALVTLLNRDREIALDEQQVLKVRRAMEHQMRFHVEAIFEALETVEAAGSHERENLEARQATLEARAAKLTYLAAFDQTYLVRDPDFSAEYLGSVEEDGFKGGLSKQDRERLLELHRWLKEIID